jgi:1,4-dihydroxy-2-naphthoate octaprenyltransferase
MSERKTGKRHARSRWLLAVRPATLPAAVAPVLVGTAAAARADVFQPIVFAVTLMAALLLQIGTNFANDLFDFRHGADTPARLGPTRATQAGLISPEQMGLATVAAFSGAVLGGIYLAWVGGWPIVTIGILSIVAGIAYTGGPWPLGYHGLGDLLVFVFFGLVAVMGTFYLQTHVITWPVAVVALPVGFLVTAILVVNNLRDIDTDRQARKTTLAVRIGARATRVQYAALLAAAYAVTLVCPLVGMGGAWLALTWLTVPLALWLARRILSGTSGHALNPLLARTAQLHLAFSVLLAVGLLAR